MIIFNKTLRLLGISVVIFGITSCAGGKNGDPAYKLAQETPFEIESAYFQEWVAGVRGGGSGTNVHLAIVNVEEGVNLEELYFQKKIVKLENSPKDVDQYIAYFKNDNNRDVIMDIDPVKESQNTPAKPFPFDLDEDEAVISFYHNAELKYALISKMEKKPLLAYPAQRSDGID